MKAHILTLLLAASFCVAANSQPTMKPLSGQAPALEWYFPSQGGRFDASVPTPSQALGFEIGERFAEWDDVLRYMETLAASSPRVSLKTFGRSFENRPFVQLCISSAANQATLEDIRKAHLAVNDFGGPAPTGQPVVVDVMASIHGNEASGVNAVLALAYYYAASEDPEVVELLSRSILLFTPGLNPDGINRFAHWVNTCSSQNHYLDQSSREYTEAAPSSRANHYWMDCNRDWLTAQFPEGRNCVQMYKYWMPNVVLDLHEQGRSKNGLYYFSPGDPNRTYPLTPQRNQDLTLMISAYTDRALGSIETPRFSRRGYDDFFIGKGAAYCDIQGGIGILHEQTSTRGHIKSFDKYGVVDFASTVRNQTLATFAVIRASYELRDTLNNYQRWFYDKLEKEVKGSGGYVFNARGNDGIARNFLSNLLLHGVRVWNVAGKPGSFAVPLEQKNSYLAHCIFDDITSYTDSVFYDISTWSPARGHNLDVACVAKLPSLGEEVTSDPAPHGSVDGQGEAYAFAPAEYYTPYMVSALQSRGFAVKVSCSGFRYGKGKEAKTFPAGTYVVPATEGVFELLSSLSADCGVDVCALVGSKKFSLDGLDLKEVRKPFCGVVLTSDASASGSVWYMLDRRFCIPHSVLSFEKFSAEKFSIDKYNSLFFAGKVPGSKSNRIAYKRIAKWVSEGGTLILQGAAHSMASGLGLEATVEETANKGVRGIVLSTTLHSESPLLWGYDQKEIALFKKGANVWKAPEGSKIVLSWSEKPYLSGCVSAGNLAKIALSPALLTMKLGKGTVIFIQEDLTYRSYWLGTNHILTNALFFGGMVE